MRQDVFAGGWGFPGPGRSRYRKRQDFSFPQRDVFGERWTCPCCRYCRRIFGARICNPQRLPPSESVNHFASDKTWRQGGTHERERSTGRTDLPQTASCFPKICLRSFRPSRTAPVVPFVPVISVLIRMRSLPALGEGIRSVTHLVPAWLVRPGGRAGLPRPRLHACAHLPVVREPENIQCPTGFIQWEPSWLAPRSRGASKLPQTHGWVESP